ncbi:hypothetical protein CXF65_09450 [Psychrobacter sp. Sarcosine-3u-12]|nr:hypothetical protein CXF65_09450 [Psychrobacter sp. Sarcosine-3u-12]
MIIEHYLSTRKCRVFYHSNGLIAAKRLFSSTHPRPCPHFKNSDKKEVNYSQTRKTAQIISRY